MSVLFRPRSAPAPISTPPPVERDGLTYEQLAAYVREIRGQTSPAGVYVDEDSAMRHDAVWSCITRKAEDVSMFPVDVIRYVGDTRQEVTPTPQIIAAPSAVVPAMDWRYQMIVAWLSAGNVWGNVTATTSNGQYPTRTELVNQCRVNIVAAPGEQLRFFVDGVERFLWPVGDLWHVPAYTMPGCSIGLSPIAYHALTISKGLAAEKFAAQFFGAGGIPVSLLMPDRDPGPTGAQSLIDGFRTATQYRDPIVLPQSIKYERIQVNPEDSQFIETERYSVEQICRIYNEDPADHGASAGGTAVTYANRSDADLARLKRRQFWVTKLQNSLTDLLPKPQVVKLNTGAALMMTEKERHEVNGLRLTQKTITVNEVRRGEDETPFDGAEYDEPGIPGGSTTPAPTTTGGTA